MKMTKKLLGLLLVLVWSMCLYAQKPETSLFQIKGESSLTKTTEVKQTKAEQRMISRKGLSIAPKNHPFKQLNDNSKLSYTKELGVQRKTKSSDYMPSFYAGLSGQALIKLAMAKNEMGKDTVDYEIADCPFAGPQTSLGGYVYPFWGTWVKNKYVGYWGLKTQMGTYLYGYIAWDPSFNLMNSNNTSGEMIGDGNLASAAGASGYKYWNQADGAAYSKTKDSIYLLAVEYNEDYSAVTNVRLGITSGTDGVVNELGSVTNLPIGEGTVSIACDNAGKLYTITFSGDLYTIDSETLAATKVGATGYVSGSYAQSMAIDPKTNKLYWAAVVMQGANPALGFFEVNTTTGAASLIEGEIRQTTCLASNYSDPDIFAPTEFSATIDNTDALKVNLKITLPTRDLNGDLILEDNSPSAVIVYVKAPGGDWTLKEEISSTAGATIVKTYTNNQNGEYGYAVAIKSKKGTIGSRFEQSVFCMKVDLPYVNGFEDSETAVQENVITAGDISLKTTEADAHTGSNSYYLFKDGYIEIKGIPVEKGGTYSVSLWSKSTDKTSWLYIGNGENTPYFRYSAANVYQKFTYLFVAEKDGQESIKIFVDYNTDNAYIDDVEIELLTSGAVPNVPTDISVKASEKGAKKALLSFTNPSLTMGEKELTELTGIIVYYGTNSQFPFGEDTAHILTNEIGKEMLDVEIDVLKDAKYYFGLVSYNKLGECAYYAAPAKNGIYIGTDIPSTPKTLKAEIKEGKLELLWSKVSTGINDAYVPENINYQLIYTRGTKRDTINDISDTSYTFETLPLDHYGFEVRAVIGDNYSLAQKTYKTFGMAFNQVMLAEASKAGSLSATFPLLMSASLSTAEKSAITQSIYQANGEAMYITKLNLLTNTATDGISQRYVVYMGYKDSSAFADTKDWVEANHLTKVFDGEIVSNSATAITQIPISGFYYDGLQPLLVSIVKPSREGAAAAWNTYTSLTAEENQWGSLHKSSAGVSFDTVNDLSEHTSLLNANTGGYVPALLVDHLSEPSKVRGSITNELGEIIEGVIRITSAEGNDQTIDVSVKTNTEGKYEFAHLPLGDFEISFSSAGYIDTVAPLKIQGEGSLITVNMVMKSATLVKISGKLIDGGDKGLSGLTVKAISTKEYVATTNTDGSFKFDVYGSSTYKFLVEKEGMKKFESTAKIGSKDTVFADFVMEYIPMDMLSVSAVVNASNAVEVKWANPGKSEIKTWNDPTDTIQNLLTASGTAVSFAHRYISTDLSSLLGKRIIKAGFVPSDPTAQYTLRICADTNTELYKKELKTSELKMYGWNDITVSSEINVPQDKELWIIIDVAAGYSNHPIAFGLSTAVAEKGDLVGLAGKWMRASTASTIKGNLLLRFTVQTEEGVEPPNAYIVYRGKSDADFSSYTKLSKDNVSGNSYTDASYAAVEPGIYRYAVCADYYHDSPKPAYSDVLLKDMEYKVDVNVKAAGGAVAKNAVFNMINKADPSYAYSAKTDANGKISIPIVWRGTYAVSISLPYHKTITEDWVVESNLTKNIQLVDIVGDPSIISVEVDGNKATMKFSANSLGGWFDGAESYEDFAVDNIGEWIMSNKTKKGRILQSNNEDEVEWKNYDVSQAFIVFNNKTTTPALGAGWNPYQGNKYFLSLFSTAGANKDMMIRSVSEGGGTLSFYQFGFGYSGAKDMYQVLYSTSDANPNSFTPVGGAAAKDLEASSSWEKVSFSIPKEAKYVAIQYKSDDIFGFAVDDVSYSVGEEVQAKSFEFYVDGTKVGEAKANETTYVFENLSVGERVLGIKSIFVSGASKLITQKVEISSAPKPVDLNVVVDKTKATLTFKAPSGYTPTSYKIYLGEEMKAENVTETSYVFTDLPEGNYVAGVVAVYASDVSEMATVDFKIEGVSTEDIESLIKTMIYPNPSSNGLYTLYVSENAHIEVIDFSGRLIDRRNVQEGKTSLNLSSMSRGIYYVRIKTKEIVKTIKVIRE